jgi:hypothetical protein
MLRASCRDTQTCEASDWPPTPNGLFGSPTMRRHGAAVAIGGSANTQVSTMNARV